MRTSYCARQMPALSSVSVYQEPEGRGAEGLFCAHLWRAGPLSPSRQSWVGKEGGSQCGVSARLALPAALQLDRNRVLETAPLGFRALLGTLGIEAALESLIKSLCTADYD